MRSTSLDSLPSVTSPLPKAKRKLRVDPSLLRLPIETLTSGEMPVSTLIHSTEEVESPFHGAPFLNLVVTVKDEDGSGIAHSNPQLCTPTIYQEHLRFMRWLRMGQFRLAHAMVMGSDSSKTGHDHFGGSACGFPNHCSSEELQEFYEAHWDESDEAELEGLLINNLDKVYDEAVNAMVSYGYNVEEVLSAVLRNGHCFGERNTFFNVIQNTTACLNSGDSSDAWGGKQGFKDLEELERRCVVDMVSMLRQMRPYLSKGDAMWCLLMCDMDVVQAGAMEDFALPPFPLPHLPPSDSTEPLVSPLPAMFSTHHCTRGCVDAPLLQCSADADEATMVSKSNSSDASDANFIMNKTLQSLQHLSLSTCLALEAPIRGGDDNRGPREVSSSSNALSKRMEALSVVGVARCEKGGGSDGIQAVESQACSRECPSSNVPPGTELSLDIASVVEDNSKLRLSYNSAGGVGDRREIMARLLGKVEELEVQLRERKAWAHEKAAQAATRFGKDMAELKRLRGEGEEVLCLRKEKKALEESAAKRLVEMEGALRKESSQLDRANAAARKFEAESAEARAEAEAAKLSGAESEAARLAAAKREKKLAKRLEAWEKQRAKLQDSIAEEKRRIAEIQEQLIHANAHQEQVEMRWRQEEKAKEEAIHQADAEKRAKEQLELTAKRKEGSIRRKMEVNSHRYKDDLKRLESELAHLKKAAEAAPVQSGSSSGPAPPPPLSKGLKAGGTHAKLTCDHAGIRCDRECVMCMCEERLVVFLPCAHQVVCLQCNDLHEKQGMQDCPSCRTPIEQRILVKALETRQ